MSYIADNLFAFRILSILVTPFNQTEAFKLGIIDENGKNLIPACSLSGNQKSAYSYLHRLVFNMKKLINKLPGGESKTKNLVSAYFLVKESYDNGAETINEDLVTESYLSKFNISVYDLDLAEEVVAANATGNVSGFTPDTVAVKQKKKILRRKPLIK